MPQLPQTVQQQAAIARQAKEVKAEGAGVEAPVLYLLTSFKIRAVVGMMPTKFLAGGTLAGLIDLNCPPEVLRHPELVLHWSTTRRAADRTVSKVINMPKPIVTADVASGSISPTSRRRPRRRAAAIARLAVAPTTTLITVATTAYCSEATMAPIGSTPSDNPGLDERWSNSVRHPIIDHRPPVRNDDARRATSGAIMTAAVVTTARRTIE